ncbi:glyoxalase [Mycolicibacterium sp. P9-64]|uniref:VOC family protein n=1 Tax=Mycolicibacterium sp. P9-64 TaxID=2024612 RepID=UPI0011EC31A7|nr:VOC family protein [Mycolicibacterium sp. P9-64]KAA0082709.1 glyoxalase [Mycolicibacterium sp. P9-64]
MVTIDELEVADPVDAWTRAGFSVDSGDDTAAVCRVGGVGIRLAGPAAAPAATSGTGAGIVGWSLRGLPPDSGLDDLDGVPTKRSTAAGATPSTHANGVRSIDHVVLLSPDLSRTVEALASVGVEPRRERDGELGGQPIRQIFFRLGEVIVEVVGSPGAAGEGPSTLWGITYVVDDIDATASFFGDRTTPVKDAVQPGRRITTLHHQKLGMSVRSAMISAPARR